MRMNMKQKISWGAGALFGIIILSYAVWQFHDIIFGIHLKVHGITDGAVYDGNRLTISGTATKAREVTIDGRGVGISKDGTFADELLLVSGYSIITIKVTDRFKKEEVRSYRVFYKPQPVSFTS